MTRAILAVDNRLPPVMSTERAGGARGRRRGGEVEVENLEVIPRVVVNAMEPGDFLS
jgi:hypothetical protein